MLVAAVGAVTAGYVIYKQYSLAKELQFQAYQPAVMPDGLHITGHHTEVHNIEGGHSKSVSLNTNDTRVVISEGKQDLYRSDKGLCESKVVNVKCQVLKTPHGNEYAVSVAYDYDGTAFNKTVSWVKGGTTFGIDFDRASLAVYPDTAWGAMIDSLQPVGYADDKATEVNIPHGG